jgi:hypothetical protein
MKPVSNIPCCDDIYGASDGFGASPLSALWETGSDSLSRAHQPSQQSAEKLFSSRVPVSHCGIKIYRPLLSFPKSRLMATCKANDVPFVTDASNFDPRTTKRNAIRWLLSNDKLPRAIRQKSILRLGAAAVKDEETRNAKVGELLRATQLASLDLRSGRLVFRAPTNIVQAFDVSEYDAACYIDHMLRLVSPRSQKGRSTSQILQVARWMFPELEVTNLPPSYKPDSQSITGSLLGDLSGPRRVLNRLSTLLPSVPRDQQRLIDTGPNGRRGTDAIGSESTPPTPPTWLVTEFARFSHVTWKT